MHGSAVTLEEARQGGTHTDCFPDDRSTSLSPIQTLTCGFREELGNTYPTASGVTGKDSHTARPQLKAKLPGSKRCALVYPVMAVMNLSTCYYVSNQLGSGLHRPRLDLRHS